MYGSGGGRVLLLGASATRGRPSMAMADNVLYHGGRAWETLNENDP